LEELKFGDVIIAVASLSVAFFLIDTVLSFALIPMNSAWGGYVADIVALLVSALVVGYVFASKIREESKIASISKVVVLLAFVMMFAVMIWFGSIPHKDAVIDEYVNSTFPTHGVTNTDWVAYEGMMLDLPTALYIVFALVFGFIGLYVGSMHKPSAKTKE
jgi:hypothetical protein